MKVNYLFTDRYGGVSKGFYESFNLALHVGDNKNNVLKNREILRRRVGEKELIFMEQIHSDKIEIVEHDKKRYICDALITDREDIALCVMVADCIPILMFDEKKGVIAAIHSGRKGTFLDIAKKCADKMVQTFGCSAQNIKAIFGPSIKSCCYEIGYEIVDIVLKKYGEKYLKDRRYLDIASINRDSLIRLGLREENIAISAICTCCSERYFSYRREKQTGRFVGVIWREER
ncbi:peptidoglycan editing factor PgeF [Nitrosophilus labii]|uniref:peptidoglycan editing factor PgeF n=1 Tax=Nitrosophilus labii TaxID=2706014 RepID=UPI0016569377|nr:peptidoglycan editing factor PgeF [Nitrosophilus labii]